MVAQCVFWIDIESVMVIGWYNAVAVCFQTCLPHYITEVDRKVMCKQPHCPTSRTSSPTDDPLFILESTIQCGLGNACDPAGLCKPNNDWMHRGSCGHTHMHTRTQRNMCRFAQPCYTYYIYVLQSEFQSRVQICIALYHSARPSLLSVSITWVAGASLKLRRPLYIDSYTEFKWHFSMISKHFLTQSVNLHSENLDYFSNTNLKSGLLLFIIFILSFRWETPCSDSVPWLCSSV